MWCAGDRCAPAFAGIIPGTYITARVKGSSTAHKRISFYLWSYAVGYLR